MRGCPCFEVRMAQSIFDENVRADTIESHGMNPLTEPLRLGRNGVRFADRRRVQKHGEVFRLLPAIVDGIGLVDRFAARLKHRCIGKQPHFAFSSQFRLATSAGIDGCSGRTNLEAYILTGRLRSSVRPCSDPRDCQPTSGLGSKLIDGSLSRVSRWRGLGPHKGVGAVVVPVIDERADLGVQVIDRRNVPRRIVWHSMKPNQISTRFIHDAELGVKCACTRVRGQSAVDLDTFVRGVIIDHRLQLAFDGGCGRTITDAVLTSPDMGWQCAGLDDLRRNIA
jgi:hypothetical protein